MIMFSTWTIAVPPIALFYSSPLSLSTSEESSGVWYRNRDIVVQLGPGFQPHGSVRMHVSAVRQGLCARYALYRLLAQLNTSGSNALHKRYTSLQHYFSTYIEFKT
ncbi:hypothetical protein C8Q70DRAFT_381588 [Cubamyces menziesii]|nr:hypothetical protein C8Q70DRAFT_381588 [Cubamyces menziesii]